MATLSTVSGCLSRRAVLSAGLVVASRVPAMASDGILEAVRWAEKTDAAYLASGRIGAEMTAAGQPMPVGWRSYRAALARLRWMARVELEALTPSTVEGAEALVAYQTARGERGGTTGAQRAARRRLREAFTRPGAVLPPRPT